MIRTGNGNGTVAEALKADVIDFVRRRQSDIEGLGELISDVRVRVPQLNAQLNGRAIAEFCFGGNAPLISAAENPDHTWNVTLQGPEKAIQLVVSEGNRGFTIEKHELLTVQGAE